ncbi:MAG TPA: hypothetical protein ENJ08_10015 [Gammaproteobacteria bacterium]|nr:hypothetical protein [Gammaproteobacteria bacterium]
MSMILFVGPSLSEKEITAHWKGLDYTLEPPARQGDIYLACQKRPSAIGIIDGYFERVPSVWHKEILWAMDQGIQIFGAASMGALRAAELSSYGMQGVGRIFSDFQSGELEDDDEVTIIHSSKEEGYESYSEAMVNIRATLASAKASGIIDNECRDSLLAYAKQLHYSQRSYDAVIHGKNADGVPILRQTETTEKLKQFVGLHSINQKQQDALALLALMSTCYKKGFSAGGKNFVFQYTENWQQMIDLLTQRQNIACADRDDSQSSTSVADVLGDGFLSRFQQKNKNEYQQIYNAARFRSMAIQESYRQGMEVTAQMLSEAKVRFCRENAFIINQRIDLEAIHRWMKQQQLNMQQFDQLMHEQARFYWYCSLTESAQLNEVVDYLKITGKYQTLAVS